METNNTTYRLATQFSKHFARVLRNVGHRATIQACGVPGYTEVVTDAPDVTGAIRCRVERITVAKL